MPTASSLRHIDPERISKNPDNPRLIFREDEMNQLLDSINKVGIRVPLAVYSQGERFVLIDGERRWRCARKLNLKTIPAIVQPKPGKLENILTMFNIHNVRVDWDLMPMALKLQEVQWLLEKDGKPAKPRDLAGITGVPFATVTRALELLELPAVYRNTLLDEGKKPKDQQKIKADLFVEINKSKRTVQRYLPEVFETVSERQYLDALVNKYRKGVVNNVVAFRQISKIARVRRTGGKSTTSPASVVVRLIREDSYSVDEAYKKSVEPAYDARDLATRASGLLQLLSKIADSETLSADTLNKLGRLRKEIDRVLNRK